MPWCPGCSHEYNPKKKKCPVCGTVLTKGPGFSKPLTYMDREWLTVRALTDDTQAEALRSFLETNGFDVAIRNGNGKAPANGKINDADQDSIMILVPLKSAKKAASLIRNDKSWLDSETLKVEVHETLEEEDYGYIDDVFEDDDHRFIESRVLPGGLDDFDDIY